MSLSDCPPSFKLVKLGNPDAERDALNAGIQAMLRCMGANSLPDPTGHAGEYLTTDGSTFSWAPTTGNDRPIVIKKDFHGVTAGDELFYYAVSPLVLNGVSILGNAVGDLVVDVRKVPFGSFPATGGDSICAAAKPTLASAQTLLSTALTGWDKGVLVGDTLTLHVDSATTVTDFEITLYGTESYLPLSYTGALTDAPLGGPVGGSITLSGGDGTYTVDASPVSGTRPAGNGLALVGAVYSDSSGVTTTAGSYSWTDRFHSGDGQTLDVPCTATVMHVPTWEEVVTSLAPVIWRPMIYASEAATEAASNQGSGTSTISLVDSTNVTFGADAIMPSSSAHKCMEVTVADYFNLSISNPITKTNAFTLYTVYKGTSGGGNQRLMYMGYGGLELNGSYVKVTAAFGSKTTTVLSSAIKDGNPHLIGFTTTGGPSAVISLWLDGVKVWTDSLGTWIGPTIYVMSGGYGSAALSRLYGKHGDFLLWDSVLSASSNEALYAAFLGVAP